MTVGPRVWFTHFSPLWVVFVNSACLGEPPPTAPAPPLYPQPTGRSSERGRPRHVGLYLFHCLYLRGSSNPTYLLRRQARHCWALLLGSYRGDIIRRWRLTDSTTFWGFFIWMECQTLKHTRFCVSFDWDTSISFCVDSEMYTQCVLDIKDQNADAYFTFGLLATCRLTTCSLAYVVIQAAKLANQDLANAPVGNEECVCQCIHKNLHTCFKRKSTVNANRSFPQIFWHTHSIDMNKAALRWSLVFSKSRTSPKF